MPRKRNSDLPSTSAGARKKSKQRRISSSDEEESGNDEDFTPETSSTLRPSQFNASTSAGADPAILINNMVRYFINFSATKYPINRAEICKAVGVAPKMFPEMIKDCETILKEVFGLALADVSENKNSSVFIVHADKNYSVGAAQYSPEQRSEITLLFIILSYIFMKNGDVQETHLTQFLQQLGISMEEPHLVFGDVGKLVKDKFPRQLYLKRSKVVIEGVNEAQVHISWGVRAEKEFNQKDVLTSVAKIMGRSPVTFINQYHGVKHAETEEQDELMVLDD